MFASPMDGQNEFDDSLPKILKGTVCVQWVKCGRRNRVRLAGREKVDLSKKNCIMCVTYKFKI